MRAAWLLVVAACSSPPQSRQPITPSSPPVATTPPATVAAPPPTTTPPPAKVADAPAVKPPPIENRVPNVPKQDFQPKLALGAPASKTKEANALNIAGLKLYGKKDLAGAEAKYVAALAADPGHAMARYNLACIYALTKRPEQAISLLLELERAKACPACWKAAALAPSDDDWQAFWDQPLFWQVLEVEADVDVGGKEDQPGADDNGSGERKADVKCPAGTTKVKAGYEAFCIKGSVKHGPYEMYEEGYDMSEGVTSTHGQYKNGKEDGAWSHHESFGAGYDGHYKNGVKHGLWIDEHKEVRTLQAYVRGKKQGYWQSQSAITGDPAILSEGAFLDDKPHGRYRAWSMEPYYLAVDGNYEKGDKVGRWTTYEDANVLSMVETYEAGKLHGEITTYAKGVKQSIAHYDHGVRHGVFEYWSGGKLVGKTTLDHGTGDWIQYTGETLAAKGKLVKDVREGHWILDDSYFEEGDFTAGKRTGPWLRFVNATKQVKLTDGAFAADKKVGPWQFWREDGTKLGKGSYVAGKADGTWIIYDEKGVDVAQEVVLANEKLVKVNGKRATKKQQRGFAAAGWFASGPAVIEELDPNPLYP